MFSIRDSMLGCAHSPLLCPRAHEVLLRRLQSAVPKGHQPRSTSQRAQVKEHEDRGAGANRDGRGAGTSTGSRDHVRKRPQDRLGKDSLYMLFSIPLPSLLLSGSFHFSFFVALSFFLLFLPFSFLREWRSAGSTPHRRGGWCSA